MSETLLIILGVSVFVITVVGVLWYFYVLLMELDERSNSPVGREVPPGAGNGNG